MLTIRSASIADLPRIGDLARAIWPVVYADMITPGQITYMLERMYAPAALEELMLVRCHRFALAENDGAPLGFAGFEHHHERTVTTRLHKLYVRPELHGQHIGRRLLAHALAAAHEKGDTTIDLTVNKRNRAIAFYRRHGFTIDREQVLDIGGGYVMDDYVMTRPTRPTDQFAEVGS
ncbi:MAG: GNAT family N-acetyltransferase [Flavobacteriales bacterium]|nr:GNAT family N-acetyltransferase [Flavobacteriales bacterium]MCB9168619.1 GNAT family N-acetyltransferase [Flavobacteriales bacterium]